MHEPVTLSGGGLWIQFTWQGDRWSHQIGVEFDGEDRSSPSSVAGLSEAGSSFLPLPPGEGQGEGTPRVGIASTSNSPRSLTSGTEEDGRQSPQLQRRMILESVEGTPDQSWPPSPPLQELHLESRPDGKELALLVGMAGNSHWSMSVEFDPVAGKAVFDVACRVKREPGALGSEYRSIAMDGEPNAIEIEDCMSTPLADLRRTGSRIELLPRSAPDQLPCTIRWRYEVAVDDSKITLKLYC